MRNKITYDHPSSWILWLWIVIIAVILLVLSVWHGIDPQGYERLNGTQATQVVNYAR